MPIFYRFFRCDAETRRSNLWNDFRLQPHQFYYTFAAMAKRMISSYNNPGTREVDLPEIADLVKEESPFSLIVWNDEVNTFEWVIETLMEVCGHSEEQAEQCAYVIHFRGKYAVKQGTYDELKPQCDAITERGIGATIEVVAT